jgi:hypothetical protein
MSFAGVAKKIVEALRDVKKAIVKAANEAPVVMKVIEETAPEVEAISNLILPGAGEVEAAGLLVLEALAGAIEAAGGAAGANGLNVTLDAEIVAAVGKVIPTLKAFAARM